MVVNQRFLYGKMMEHGGKPEVFIWENDGTWCKSEVFI